MLTILSQITACIHCWTFSFVFVWDCVGGDSQRSNSVTRVPPLYTFLSLKYTLMSLFIPLSVGIVCSGGTFGKWRKTNRTYPSMFTSTSLYSAVLSPWARVIAVSVYRRHSKWTGPTESIPVLYWTVRGLDKDECYWNKLLGMLQSNKLTQYYTINMCSIIHCTPAHPM